MQVLIVDDSKAMRMIVRRTLRQAGFDDWTSAEAANGNEAFQSVQDNMPDLILCDWNMPEMNGLQLLEKLKDAGHSVKFGFVTSESTPEMSQAAAQAGALFLITKPFTPEQFQKTLGPILED